MIDDHYRQHSSGGARPMPGRRKTSEALPWGVGVPIILLMSLSVFASLWLGWRINKDLGELSRNRQVCADVTEMNRELIARRDSLLAKENIVKKAAVLGLLPPTDKQVRKIKNP